MKDRRQRIAVTLLLGVLLTGYTVLPLDDMVQRLWYDATGITAMALGFWGLFAHRPTHLRGWLLVLIGFSGWVCGDLVWLVQQWADDTAFPAPSDALYLSSYLVLGAGALAMVRTRRSGGDRAAFLDAAILTTGAAVLIIVFMVAPLTGDATMSVAARVVSSAYPIGDIFLVAALARMLTSAGAKNRSFRLLLGALLLTTAADMTWNVMVALSGNTAEESHWLDAAWLGAYVLASAAANSPTMSLVAEPAPPSDAVGIGRRRIAAMGVGLLLPVAVLCADGILSGAANWPVIACGAAVMSILVLVRLVDLLAIVKTQAVQLAALARTDPLTGAPNRRTWDHELSQACLRARDHDSLLSLAILDLDHFKTFNDTHGHPAGDQLLREAVALWSDALPPGATLARYGGEEFAVLLPGYPLDAAQAALTLLKSRTPGGQTFSAGVAAWGQATTPAALLTAADKALYRAKRSGRNQIAIAVDDSHDLLTRTNGHGPSGLSADR